jgi:hypothetical protein
MGMIPVVLAIAGFVFLWVIVNYNSLSARRTNIASLQAARNKLVDSYISLSKQISALLLIYQINMPPYLINLSNNSDQKIHGSKLTESIKGLQLQVSTHSPGLESNPDYQELIGLLEATAGKLLRNQQQLLAEVKAYNQQATRMPYRIVAHLFGFKGIDSPVG